jgi:septum formation protein
LNDIIFGCPSQNKVCLKNAAQALVVAAFSGEFMTRTLVLASTSPYRRELLERLGLPFVVANPDTDESAHPGEAPEALALRLSEAKARAVADTYPDALIIGSDQVAVMDGRVFGKPGTHERAVEQLQVLSGHSVNFFTGLCLFDARNKQTQLRGVPTWVTFRSLTANEIENYLRREQPYNCAGAAKSEGLGIALLQKMEGEDPNALIGLPLIALCDMLRLAGVDVL